MFRYRGAYIRGRFIQPSKRHRRHIKRDPGNTDRILGDWRETTENVDDAVQAAAQAFEPWAWLSDEERHAALQRYQAVLKKKAGKMAECISSEMGKTLVESKAEVDSAILKIDATLRWGLSMVQSRRSNGSGYYRYHPRGVFAVIGPFNFPLHLPNGNIVAALATGNTVVFKPSEQTPFTGQFMAECFHEADFPKGVFNLVQGRAMVGEALVEHPNIQGIVFVGSDSVGRRIQKSVIDNPNKICILEMGGKNAAIVMSDAEMENALTSCVRSALSTTGQRCNALSRILVHEDRITEFTVELASRALAWKPGYFRDPSASMGPLVSKNAVRDYLHYQDLARREGAREVLKGRTIELEHPGYYVTPAIHRLEWSGSHPRHKGYRYDEIFGPDVAIYSFRTMEEAIRIHNDARYGLVASVFTKKKSTFEAMFRHLEVGNLHWNRPTIGTSSRLPFGGIKSSGNGFPAGVMSPLFCTYPVAVQM